jgi:hypothetical protein
VADSKNIPGLDLYSATSSGKIISKKTGLEIKELFRKDGYINVHVFVGKINNKKKYSLKLQHRLVAAAFFGESALDVNHKNGIKADNRIENLEYCTRSQNIRHSIDVLGNKHWSLGSDNSNSKINLETHKFINKFYKNKVANADEIAKLFDINKATVMNHVRNSKRIEKCLR